jgi:hypothetical protein
VGGAGLLASPWPAETQDYLNANTSRPVRAARCRNGPGKFTIGDTKIDHPYDGDGYVTSFAFKGGRVFCRSRFVHTAE